MRNLYRTDVYQPSWLLKIPRAYRNAAAGVWARCGSYAAREETDGFIPDEIVDGFATPIEVERLVADAEMLVRDDVRGGWQMLEWAPNPTHDQLASLRAKDAARARAERAAAKPLSAQTSEQTSAPTEAEILRPYVRLDVRAGTSTKSSSLSSSKTKEQEQNHSHSYDDPGKAKGATDEERAARVAADTAARNAQAAATAAARQQAKDAAALVAVGP
jgi:hypothetical protein